LPALKFAFYGRGQRSLFSPGAFSVPDSFFFHSSFSCRFFKSFPQVFVHLFPFIAGSPSIFLLDFYAPIICLVFRIFTSLSLLSFCPLSIRPLIFIARPSGSLSWCLCAGFQACCGHPSHLKLCADLSIPPPFLLSSPKRRDLFFVFFYRKMRATPPQFFFPGLLMRIPLDLQGRVSLFPPPPPTKPFWGALNFLTRFPTLRGLVLCHKTVTIMQSHGGFPPPTPSFRPGTLLSPPPSPLPSFSLGPSSNVDRSLLILCFLMRKLVVFFVSLDFTSYPTSY